MDKDGLEERREAVAAALDKELLMRLYEKIDKDLEELYDRFYLGKYEPSRDPYWEGVCDGVSNAWRAVDKAFREASGV